MGWLKQAFSSVAYIVIDEFHAFIGSERGVQLLLLTELTMLGCRVGSTPRCVECHAGGTGESSKCCARTNERLPCVTRYRGNSMATLPGTGQRVPGASGIQNE